MKLNVVGYMSGNLGYNIHTRNFVEGLERIGIDVSALPLEDRPASEISPLVTSCIKKKPHLNSPTVCISYGNDMFRFYGTKRIGYTVWETSKIPADWVPQLNALDDVWTVSKHCKDVFEDCGVKHDVKIVKEGVDDTVFNPYAKKMKFKNDPFVFLSIFKWEERKSPDILIEAFAEEFAPDENVMLMMQCSNPFLRNFNPYMLMHEMNLGKHAPIAVAAPLEKHVDMPQYYVSANCFVLPTKGESCGLPLIESMACGVPVITTNWGGSLDYVNSDVGWLIDVERMETPDDGMFFKKEMLPEGNQWAVPSKDHLKKLMREAFDNKEATKARGERAHKYVRENLTLEKVVSGVKDLL